MDNESISREIGRKQYFLNKNPFCKQEENVIKGLAFFTRKLEESIKRKSFVHQNAEVVKHLFASYRGLDVVEPSIVIGVEKLLHEAYKHDSY
ncbi:MAG: hypothetical protein ACMXYD_02600 [Candidatus Woesearchaeota archaeon]